MKTEKSEAVSSGGVVARVNNGVVEILLLRDKRFKDWTLPKGHCEPGENLEQAALREIREESGVTNAKILAALGTARRYVVRAQEWKTIHYFLFLTDSDEPKALPESDYMETRWFNPDKLPKIYLSEQEKIIKDNIEKIKSVK